MKENWSERRESHTRDLGPKPSAWLLGYAPMKKWEQDSELHGKEPAYETGGGAVRFLLSEKMVEARGCAPRSRGLQPRAITRSA